MLKPSFSVGRSSMSVKTQFLRDCPKLMLVGNSLATRFPRIIAGWWFGTFFIFPKFGNNHPN